MNLIYEKESYKLIGAAQEVHRMLGHGFLESVYQEAMAIELINRHIPFEQEKELSIFYKETKLSKKYYADFICFNNIVVEMKALNSLSNNHDAQVLNYLKATKMRLGLLFNFGEESLKVKRIVL